MKQLSLLTLLICSTTCAVENSPSYGPYSPTEAGEHFQLHPDCRIELVAAEPDVVDPVHIEFAPDGKLWVVEYSDYPNGPAETRPGASRIRVLSDADGDGRFSDPVTFAENLLFANSLLLWDGGAIVTTDGKLLFLKDTDADGVADHEEVWFEGFATENPQLRHNHPTLGPDNKIYVANGLRGGKIVPGKTNPWGLKVPEEPLSISGMDFCFDPITGAYEAVSGNGQFGLCFDDWGNRFTCTNRNPCKHIVLEDKYLKRNPQLRVRQVYEDVSPAGEASQLFPISRTWTTSNLHANQFTAACGVTIYRGHGLGEAFYGNSFTCDPTANLVHRDVLTPRGATMRSKPGRDGVEFLATQDEWFRPVNMAHGPDGALYVVDMYRAVIEHPQFMPEELKNRPDLGFGTDKGRIWRITSYADRTNFPQSALSLGDVSSQELVELLKHENSWQRETARRLILERQEVADEQLLVSLKKLVQMSTDARIVNVAASTLLGLQETEDALRLDVPHPVPKNWSRVIEHAVRLSERIPLSDAALQKLNHMRVATYLDPRPEWIDDRLHFQFALSMPPEKMTGSFVKHQFRNFEKLDPDKQWLRFALLSCVDTTDLRNLELCDGYLLSGTIPELTTAQRYVYEELGAMFAHLPWSDKVIGHTADPRTLQRSFALLRGRLQRNPRISGWQDAAAPVDPEFFNITANWINVLEKSDADRIAAIQALIWSATDLAVKTLQPVLANPARTSLHTQCINTLGYHNDQAAVALLVNAYNDGTPQLKREIIAALSRTSVGIDGLLDEVEQERISPFEVDPGILKALSRNKTFAARANELLSRPPAQDRLLVLNDYADCLSLDSDPLRGRKIFEKNCATCHKIGNVGVNVAPDISDSRTKTMEFLLTNILDPNRAIDNNYFSYTVLDTAGRVHTGVVSSETSTAITLRQPEGKTISISRDEIEEFKNNGVSLMPVGLERTINKQQMADLISFIKNWRYLDGLVPKEVIR